MGVRDGLAVATAFVLEFWHCCDSAMTPLQK